VVKGQTLSFGQNSRNPRSFVVSRSATYMVPVLPAGSINGPTAEFVFLPLPPEEQLSGFVSLAFSLCSDKLTFVSLWLITANARRCECQQPLDRRRKDGCFASHEQFPLRISRTYQTISRCRSYYPQHAQKQSLQLSRLSFGSILPFQVCFDRSSLLDFMVNYLPSPLSHLHRYLDQSPGLQEGSFNLRRPHLLRVEEVL